MKSNIAISVFSRRSGTLALQVFRRRAWIFAEFRIRGRGPASESNVDQCVPFKRDLAAAGDDVRIHGPCQTVISERARHIRQSLRGGRTQETESRRATERSASGIGFGEARLLADVIIRRSLGHEEGDGGRDEASLWLRRFDSTFLVHLELRLAIRIGRLE